MAGTQNQPTEYEQVSYNSDGGAQFGRTSTELISLWGATPAIKTGTAVTNISTTAFQSTAGIYGFATSTEALQVTSALSTVIIALKSLGAIV